MQTMLSINTEAGAFYAECLDLLVASGIPFLLGGSFAVSTYTGLRARTKDLDVFCKPGDCPRILTYFRARDFAIEVEDERSAGCSLQPLSRSHRGWLRSCAWINRWRLAAIHRGSSAWVVSLGACRLLSKGERAIADSSPTQRALPLTLHSLVAIDRNRWSPSIGITGRLQSEQVVAITRCAHLRL
jgi:hypothetical protein